MIRPPDAKAVIPKPTWNINGHRNGVVPITIRKPVPAKSVVSANVGILKSERSMSGCTARRKCTNASAHNTTPPPINTPVIVASKFGRPS